MSYEDPRRSDSLSAIVAVAAVVVVLIVGGLVLAGAAAYFLLNARTRAVATAELVARQRAKELQARTAMERDRARAAEEMAARARAGAAEEANDRPTSQREFTIRLDKDGNIEADGKSTQLDDLSAILRIAVEAPDARPLVVIRADHRCLFEHVAALLAVCEKLGIDDVHVASSQEPPQRSDPSRDEEDADS